MITDEMVERACRAYNVGWSLWQTPQKNTAREVMRAALAAASSALEPQEPGVRAFRVGQKVRKKSGSWWEGLVVGHYTTEQTPDGVCVQLDKPMGPVQIYPASALELSLGAQEPDGWKLVPVEPTHEMMKAGQDRRNAKALFDLNDAYHAYKAMIAAAPPHTEGK